MACFQPYLLALQRSSRQSEYTYACAALLPVQAGPSVHTVAILWLLSSWSCPLALFAVMFLMQLFPVLAKARVPALLPSMVTAACQRGPELSALPPCPQAVWDKELEKRQRDMRERQQRGQTAEQVSEEKWKEQVQEKWKEGVLGAVTDLKVAQV